MAKFNLGTLLGVLPVVGPVIAAAPEFKKLYDTFVDALDGGEDQATAKEAYDLAISEAREDRKRMQELANRYGG